MTPGEARARVEAPDTDLAGRRAVVMGLGRFGGGVGAARYLARRGARVLVTDLRSADELVDSLSALAGLDVETRLGGHDEADFATAELVVANPAVRPDHPLLGAARRAGARIASEIELFLRASPARTVCVSGTQGKSSTCHALASLLACSGHVVHAGGNLGGSLLERLDTIQPTDLVVLELSSYQLEALADPAACGRRVEAVALTNVLADHIERHGSLAAYVAAKARLFELAGPGAARVVPADDARLVAIADAAPRGRLVRHAARAGVEAELDVASGRFRLDGEELGRVADVRLPGAFQVANMLVSLGLARLVGAPAAALREALRGVTGLPHRMEDLGLRRGRHVVDNGVSTTPDSTVSALESLAPGATLIAGGQRKDLAVEELVDTLHRLGGRAVTFGRDGDSLADAFAASGVEVAREQTVEGALARALVITPRGANVLFSPACASFDAYPNFRERALAFRRELDRLAPQGAR